MGMKELAARVKPLEVFLAVTHQEQRVMSILPSKVFVGLDYHQHTIQVCVLDEQGNQLINATRANAWQSVAEVVPEGVVVHAAIESCCGAANFAEEMLQHTDWNLHLAHAGYVHRMKQSPDKTDYSDARLLADLTRVGYLPKVWLAPLKTRELRRLIRYRQQQVNDRKSEKLRCSAILRDLRLKHPEGKRSWSKPWREWLVSLEMPSQSRWTMDQHLLKIEFLNQQIKLTEDRLKETIGEDRLTKWLLTQEGIGLVTAVTLRAELGRFDRFRSGKQLARFCGVTPMNASSGERQADAGLIKAGNRELRRVLIEAAHRLKRHSERWSELAERMKDRGKAPGVISAAVANRWIRSLFYQEREAAKEGYSLAA